MERYGLIGYPLEHSFSKSYFEEKFLRENRTGMSYENYPIPTIEEFHSLCQSVKNLKGLNVTIPYKEQVINYLDALSDDARAVGAVNTICFCRRSGRLALVGHNTDTTGFEKSLLENLAKLPPKALVLGTGGASKAVIHILKKHDIEVQKVSRNKGPDTITYSELTRDMITSSRLVVNTTPLGMYPHTREAPGIPYDALTPEHYLFDLIYNPPETRFLKEGRTRGASTINGEKMLIYQAEASWLIWNRQDMLTRTSQH